MNYETGLHHAFYDATNDPIFIVDAATKTVLDANAQASEDCGYRPEEGKGLAIDRLVRSRNGLELMFERRSQKTYWEGLQLLRKGGDPLAVNVSATWVEWNSRSYIFVIACRTEGTLPVRDERGQDPGSTRREDMSFPMIIGQSEKIRDVCRLIGSVAKSNANVLIQGESGTGKEIIANAIYAHSHRCCGPFVKVNCAALTETLLESELFGHVRGAFTGSVRDRHGRFKQADGGTILLDEIGSMSPAGQAKLLRVLQEREFEPVGSSVTTSVDVRVLASTNTELVKTVSEGKFREDLYYRLNVFSISLPPLRERKEDIPLLGKYFVQHHAKTVGKDIRSIAPEALSLLLQYDWPGNVRELGNAIEHAVIVEKGPAIRPSSLPMNLAQSGAMESAPEPALEPGLREKLNLLEKEILREALSRAHGIKCQAAAMLRVDPRNLPYLLRKHHLGENIRRH
ncbi:MAG: sigma-54 interaction domain-containing protein [Chromatiales bacterium]